MAGRVERALRAIVSLLDGGATEAVSDAVAGIGSFWQNPYTGVGTANDKSTWTMPTDVTPLSVETLAALWQQDPIAGTAINAIVDDGLAHGCQVAYYGDSEADKALVENVGEEPLRLNVLGLEEAIRLGAKTARALGGGGVFPIVNGGSLDSTMPFRLELVRSVERLIPVDRRDLVVQSWDIDRHSFYSYQPTTGRVHAGRLHSSHIVRFRGLDTMYRDSRDRYESWDQPVLQRVWEAIRDFRQPWMSTIGSIQDSSQGVLKIPNLWRTLASQGRSALTNHLIELQMGRANHRIMPISADEDFSFSSRTYAGVAELLRECQPLVAQAAEMPITRLFGVSPAGMNATGVSDERNWLSRVASYRRAKIDPPADHLVKILAKACGAQDLDGWCVDWPSLEVMTAAEQAELEKTEAETDAIRIEKVGLPKETVLLHRYGGDEYTATAPRLGAELEEELRTALEPDEEAEAPTGDVDTADIVEVIRLVLEEELTPAGAVEVLVASTSISREAAEAIIAEVTIPDEPAASAPDEPSDPGEPVDEDAPPEAVDPQTALNGAQVTALLGVVQQVVQGQLPRASAIEIITSAFPVDRPTAERILGTVGKGFEPGDEPGPEPMAPAPGVVPPQLEAFQPGADDEEPAEDDPEAEGGEQESDDEDDSE